MLRRFSFLIFIMIISLMGCKKQADFSLPALSEYYPMQIGATFVYRLDSTVLDPFGTTLLTRTYIAEDIVQDTFRDNDGRLSYRFFRYTTDTLEQSPWTYESTYYVTPTSQDVEVVDASNLRFIKLTEPLVNGFDWLGNTYIDTKSATSPYQYMDGWDYVYQNFNMPYTVLKGTLDSTVTVLQDDETTPDTTFNPANYQQRNYSIEIYARGIGLIYKDFLHWTWQPTAGDNGAYTDDSYGIKLDLIAVR